MDLVDRLLLGDRKALARFLRGLEEMESWAYSGLKRIIPYVKNTHIIGITGSQGVGKSTFIDRIIEEFSKENKSVAVLLVDPTSEVSGGTFFGDRIRMQRHANNPLVFIKSVPSQSSTGGLGLSTWWMIETFCATGFDYVIIETVGVGQDEKEVKEAAFTTVLLLSPSHGDDIQMLKAGLIEVADIIVVNKADLPEGELLAAYLSKFENYSENGWRVPVIAVSARTGKGTREVLEYLDRHLEFLKQKEMIVKKHHDLIKKALEKLFIYFIQTKLKKGEVYDQILHRLLSGQIDPFEAVRELFGAYGLNSPSNISVKTPPSSFG